MCHEPPLILVLHTFVNGVGEHIFDCIRSHVDGKRVLLDIFSRCMEPELTATLNIAGISVMSL